jgi:hypothetical protein
VVAGEGAAGVALVRTLAATTVALAVAALILIALGPG